jgi:uncharacterized integral membrane protein
MEDNDINIIWIWIGIASILFFTISIILIYNNWYEIKLNYFGDINSFPKIEGTIQDAGIAISNRKTYIYYYPCVTYSYNVNNVKYKSERISFEGVRFNENGLAESYMRRFPIGGKVQVYYDPEDPRISVLDPNGRNYYVIEFIGVLSFLLLIVVFIVRRYFRSRYKQASVLLEERLDKSVGEDENK